MLYYWLGDSYEWIQVISVTANGSSGGRTHMHVPHSPLSKMLPSKKRQNLASGSFRSWGPQDKDQTWAENLECEGRG